MINKGTNHLKHASKIKNDEFYTMYDDVEDILKYYIDNDTFKDKSIYCNCDDFKSSNFVKFFINNFYKLKLKKLVVSSYDEDSTSTRIYEIYKNTNYNILSSYIIINDCNGDCLDDKLLPILNSVDYVVTNPPFSKFREIVKYYTDNSIKFILVGLNLAASYIDILQLYTNNYIYYSKEIDLKFIPTFKRVKCRIYNNFINYDNTNLKTLPAIDFEKLSSCTYLDDTCILNVDEFKFFPSDYVDFISVPVTIFNYDLKNYNVFEKIRSPRVGGKEKFARILIKMKK